MLTSRSEFGKTFTTAMWLLGTLAAVQMFAVGWAIVTRPALAAGATTAEVQSVPPSQSPETTASMPAEREPEVENFDPFAPGQALR